MPDLGKYAEVVLSSYAVSLILLGGLVGISIWKGARIRRELEEVEKRRQGNG